MDSPTAKSSELDPERFRAYLRLQAKMLLHPRLRGRIEVSDLVQETLLDAHTDRDAFRGETPGQLLAWLKRILAHNLAGAVRHLARDKRDPAREVALADAARESAVRLEAWLVADEPTPSRLAEDEERFGRLVAAVSKLPEDQCEAVLLRYWQGLALNEIARRMGRTHPSVAGLLHRGLATLRNRLGTGESHL